MQGASLSASINLYPSSRVLIWSLPPQISSQNKRNCSSSKLMAQHFFSIKFKTMNNAYSKQTNLKRPCVTNQRKWTPRDSHSRTLMFTPPILTLLCGRRVIFNKQLRWWIKKFMTSLFSRIIISQTAWSHQCKFRYLWNPAMPRAVCQGEKWATVRLKWSGRTRTDRTRWQPRFLCTSYN